MSTKRERDWGSQLIVSTLSYAALFGIREDLGLKGTQYSTLSSIFYVGWLVWAIPGNLLMAKFPLSKYLAVNVSHARFPLRAKLMIRSSSGVPSSLPRAVLRTLRTCSFSVSSLVLSKRSPSLGSVSPPFDIC